MGNPIVTRGSWLIIYLFWWILPGSIHSFVLVNAYNYEPWLAAMDSLISFFALAVFQLSLWWMVRFTVSDEIPIRSKIINHLIALSVVFVLWIGLIMLLMNVLFHQFDLDFARTILWRLLVFLPVYLLIIAVYYLLSYQEKLRDHQLVESQMQAQLKESELVALKSQINPHFLFNSLNSVSGMLMLDSHKAREMLVKISDFFRGSLILGKNIFIPFQDELEHVMLYLEIEKARFGDKIVVVSELSQDAMSVEVPSLILQPIVENAVKHGVYEAVSPVKIRFRSEMSDASMLLEISNDLCDSAGVSRKGTGTGLNNVALRMQTAYNSNSYFSFRKTESQFVVKFTFPLKRESYET
ncbi:MAG: histidine kinase [Bacteroidales bacterium]|nr:histidine kinase [Bacteroidales bacterium]